MTFSPHRLVGSWLSLPRDARLYLIAEALSSFAAGALGAVFNLYLVALGFDTRFVGLLLAVTLAGAGAGAVPAGALVDRFGARAVLLGGSVVAAAGIAAQLAGAGAPLLLAGGAVAGAGAAAFGIAAAPFLVACAPEGRRTELFSLDTAVALAATAAGSALGGQLAAAAAAVDGWGARSSSLPSLATLALPWLAGAGSVAPSATAAAYRLALLAAGAVGACSFFALLLTRGDRPSPDSTAPRGAPAGRWGAGADASTGPAMNPAPVEPDDRTAASWRVALAHPTALKLAATAALISLGAGLFLPYVNLYFTQQLGASPALYGWLEAAATATRLAATLLAPRLAARTGEVRAVAWTQLASVPLLLVLGFAPTAGVAGAAYLLRGAAMNMAAPVRDAFGMAALPPALRGSGNATIWVAGNATRGLSTLAGGWLIAAAGYRFPYVLTAACYVAASLLFLHWFSPISPSPLPREGVRG